MIRVKDRRRRPRKEEGKKGAPEWMVTYGDMMSLLLCFFVLIVSFSSIQLAEFQKAMGSLRGALGVLKTRSSVIKLQDIEIPHLTGFKRVELNRAIEAMRKLIEQKRLEGLVKMKITRKGIAIRLLTPVLFELGKAEIKPEAYPILDRIIDMAKALPNRVRIEGHTCNLPIHTPEFPSNWELSAIRAIKVVHYFQDVGGIDPRRLYYMGFGEYHPLVPNTSEENRAKNRRVEIFIEYERSPLQEMRDIFEGL